MPSPIMLPPTPDLHPIRQELLRGLVRAIRMSKRQCRDMALKIAAHGIHTSVKPRARGGLKPAQRLRRPRRRQRIVRSICLAIATLSRRSRRGSRAPPFEPPSSQLWAVWPKSSTLCFWRGAVATRRRTPPPRAEHPNTQAWGRRKDVKVFGCSDVYHWMDRTAKAVCLPDCGRTCP